MNFFVLEKQATRQRKPKTSIQGNCNQTQDWFWMQSDLGQAQSAKNNGIEPGTGLIHHSTNMMQRVSRDQSIQWVAITNYAQFESSFEL